MAAGIIAFLQALPALIGLISEVGAWMKKQFGDDPSKFLLDSTAAFKRLNEAKDSHERIQAASEVQALIKRLVNGG